MHEKYLYYISNEIYIYLLHSNFQFIVFFTLSRKMSGFSYENSSAELHINETESLNIHHNESTPIVANTNVSNSSTTLKHSNSSSTLLTRSKLTRKFSEQKEISYVLSPEELVQKYSGNHVIKKVN